MSPDTFSTQIILIYYDLIRSIISSKDKAGHLFEMKMGIGFTKENRKMVLRIGSSLMPLFVPFVDGEADHLL